MTPRMCQVRHAPPERYGDCLRACIASLLNMEPVDVPHFADNGVDSVVMIDNCRSWLKTQGYNAWLVQYPSEVSDRDVRALMAVLNPGQHYLMFSENHVVVCKDFDIVHDPSWYKVQLAQPREAWTLMVLTLCV